MPLFRIMEGQKWTVTVGKRGKQRLKAKYVLTYPSLRTIFTVPGVAKDGVGQFIAECDIEIPQWNLTTFEPLPGPTITPTGTDR